MEAGVFLVSPTTFTAQLQVIATGHRGCGSSSRPTR